MRNKLAIKEDHFIHSNTGLVISNNYESASGINYIEGVRDFENLTIVESIGHGTAVTFLSGVKIFDKSNKLIVDKAIKKKTYYSREVARSIVFESLLEMLQDASKQENKPFDRFKASVLINDKLKNAYYKESYEAILSWAEDLGII